MKKITSIISLTLISMFFVFFTNVSAEVVTIDGFQFDTATGTIEKYIGAETSLVIPNQINSVEVKLIGENAFSDCTSLKQIEIPNSITSIGAHAFYNCTSLRQIEIPNSVTVIRDFAFANCRGLEQIEIPNSVTTIGYRIFYNCTNLSQINVKSNNQYYSSDNGVLFNKQKTKLISFPIGASFKVYSMPNSVTSIEAFAFENCTNLEQIKIPNSVTIIGDGAFDNCTSLEQIEIPNSVTMIGYSAFYECISLRQIEIPNSVTTIGDSAFSYCTSLSQINVKSDNQYYSSDNGVLFNKKKTKLISFPSGALFKAYSIPNSVTSIEAYAFSYCTSLSQIKIPNSVTSIGAYAFSYCTSLSQIKIPNSVTSIGAYAFANSTSLSQVEIPNNITTIEAHAFSYCTSLSQIKIPNSVTSIRDFAFANCKSLEQIEIPNSVTTIGNSAFNSCISLSQIKIPNSITTIGGSTFSYCRSLEQIEIPNSVTTIGDSAFSNCTSLRQIEIPNSVTTIGNSAFSNCTNLTDIKILNKLVNINSTTFKYSSKIDTVYCYRNSTADNESLYPNPNVKIYYLDGAKTVDFKVKDAEGRAGEKIDIYVSVDNNPGLVLYDLKVNFDKTKLTPLSVTQINLSETKEELVSNVHMPNVDLSTLDYVSAVWNSASNTIYNGDLFKIQFKIKEDVLCSELPITLEFNKNGLLNENYELLAPNITNGKVIVYPQYNFGDITMDEGIDGKDLLILTQYLAEYNNIELNALQIYLSDVYKDEIVDLLDLVLLKQYLAGWDDIVLGKEIKTRSARIGNNSINLDLKSEYISQDEIKVSVTAKDNSGIAAFKLKLNYDNKVLTPVSLTKGNAITRGDITTNIKSITEDKVYVTALWSDTSNITENGVLYDVVFKVKDRKASNTRLNITFEDKGIINESFSSVSTNKAEKDIELSKEEDNNIIYGDTNGDKNVTAEDAALILQHTLNPKDNPFNDDELKASIVSSKDNTETTANDAAYVLQKVLNGNIKFPVEN